MTDVTVYGAGVFGLSIAWACLQRGAKVRVIDPAGVGTGASGGVVGALAPHVPETWNDKKQFQLDSLLMAETWWSGVARASGRDPGYGRTGRVQPLMTAEAAALARTREATADALWAGAAKWRVRPVSEEEGDWLPPGVTEVVEDTLTARILPAPARVRAWGIGSGHAALRPPSAAPPVPPPERGKARRPAHAAPPTRRPPGRADRIPARR